MAVRIGIFRQAKNNTGADLVYDAISSFSNLVELRDHRGVIDQTHAPGAKEP